ncbi:MAG: DUF4367 domain-containing protein [Oscillospiraceae bacterium]|nr:DUF4367 domain-containing protein [Oscillospiraceae bacterium]
MKYTYDEMDKMSCDELENLINEDALLPESEQLSSEELLYILQRMEVKGEYEDKFSETDRARETFLDVYYKPKTKKFGFIKNNRTLKTACIVLAMLLFFALGGVTAEAAKFGHEKSDIHWTDESFSFSGIEGFVQGVPAAGDFETLPVLQQYQDILTKQTSLKDVMVTYLPDKYYVLEYTYKEGLQSFELKIELYKWWEPSDPHIILWYNQPQYVGTGNEYEKDPGRPEEYITNGITHYLMTNDGLWQALWTNGSLECCISGIESKEILIKMIDSIYERDIS